MMLQIVIALVLGQAAGVPSASQSPEQRPQHFELFDYDRWHGWYGTNLGIVAHPRSPVEPALLIGWEGGLVREGSLGEKEFGVGPGAKLAYTRHWQLALPVRLQLGMSSQENFYVQAGPLRSERRWGVDAETGYDFSFAAIYFGGYRAADETSILLGARVSIVFLLAVLLFHP